MPKISVIIPTLNEEKYLAYCLESLKKQTFSDFEIIISDGGSTDKTQQIAKDYHAKVIVYKNSNVCLARDIGVRAAKGEIIVGADADTFYPKDHLETIYQEFQKNKDVVAISGKVIFHNCPWWWKPVWIFTYRMIEIIYQLTGVVTYTPALNLSFRRDAFMRVGGYNTKLDFGGDEMDIMQRLKKAGRVIYKYDLNPETNSRRLKLGFFTFLFKHLLFNYWFNYLSAKILGKAIIRAKPVR